MIRNIEQSANVTTKTWFKRLAPILLLACALTYQYSRTFEKSFIEFKHRDFEKSSYTGWGHPAPMNAKLVDYDVASKDDYLATSNFKYLPPMCENFLANFTSGKWIRKSDTLRSYKKERRYWIRKENDIDELLRNYWIDRGIGSSFTGKEGKCGYQTYQIKIPGSEWPGVGSWCDKNGDRPCCDDMYSGTCVTKANGRCNCDRCVDMTKLLHAETSQWIVDDKRCKWRNYSAEESCNILADSPYDLIHFAGDSMLRNFYQALVMILAGNPGSTPNHFKKDIPEKCKGQELFYWPECRKALMPPSKYTCKDGRSFKLFRCSVMNIDHANKFLNIVKSAAGKPNTLAVLAVGIHLSYKFSDVHSAYLKPAVDLIERAYRKRKAESPWQAVERWPKLMIFSAQKVGLLKPTKYLGLQGPSRNFRYHAEMKLFCDTHDIPFLNFVPLTKQILSFDGTHQGLAVNLLKAQMFLNYIAGQK